MKSDLIVSASGGRTSMMMSVLLKRNYSEKYNLKFLFCNTGQEETETLDFVDRVDMDFGLDIVWIESVTHLNERKGSTYKIVDRESASTDGKPFEDMIEKYGIPNKAYPHCNRELKLNPMFNWRRDNMPDASFAVGIRTDEMDRMASTASRDRVIYPFISLMPTNKKDVLEWWSQYPYTDLRIPEHHGNCKTCWKKSDRKLMTRALEDPTVFDFMDRMEVEKGTCGANDDSRVFFRGKINAKELIERAKTEDFKLFTDPHDYDGKLDVSNGCTESCDVFADI